MDKEAPREAAIAELKEKESPMWDNLPSYEDAYRRGFNAGAAATAEAKVKGLVERLESISQLLSSDHVQHNKHRMGLLACHDIDYALDAARGEGK